MHESKNKVFLNSNGLIEIIVNGDQTVASVQAMGDEAERLCIKQHENNKKALVLDNLLQIGEVPQEARQLVVRLAKTMEYDKLAMVGNGTILRLGANLMLQATRRADKVKYFDDYDKATDWLKAE